MFIRLCGRVLGRFGFVVIGRRQLDGERRESAELQRALALEKETVRHLLGKIRRDRARLLGAQAALDAAAVKAGEAMRNLVARRENDRTEFGRSFARLAAKLQSSRARHAKTRAAVEEAVAKSDHDRKQIAELLRLFREERERNRLLDERLAAASAFAAAESEKRNEHAAAIDLVRELDSRRALEQAILTAPEPPTQPGRRRPADDQQAAFRSARAYFALGRAFQAKGEITLAARAYKRAGPYISEFLAEITPPDVPGFSGLDVMIIGAARSGTTWLRERLSLHPDIFLQPREGSYFSACPYLSLESYLSTYWRRTGRSLKKRKAADSRLESSLPKLFGEKSPAYLDMPESSIELCAALFPKLRIVCLVREPVSRAWSRIKQLGLAGRADDLGHLRSQPIGNSLEEIVRQGRYQEHLRRWASHYPPEQILVVEFARIWAEPERVYAEVLQHLGAGHWPFPDLGPRGETGDASDIPAPLLSYLQAVYEGERFDALSLTRAMEAVGQGPRASLHDGPSLRPGQARSSPIRPAGTEAAGP